MNTPNILDICSWPSANNRSCLLLNVAFIQIFFLKVYGFMFFFCCCWKLLFATTTKHPLRKSHNCAYYIIFTVYFSSMNNYAGYEASTESAWSLSSFNMMLNKRNKSYERICHNVMAKTCYTPLGKFSAYYMLLCKKQLGIPEVTSMSFLVRFLNSWKKNFRS